LRDNARATMLAENAQPSGNRSIRETLTTNSQLLQDIIQ
jgi:hypothetical protein